MMIHRKLLCRGAFLLLFFTILFQKNTFSQDLLLQGWYWDYPKTANGFNWADTLLNRADALSDGGFTYVWLPPLSRASFGSGSNGYDPKDLYDLGEFGQGATGFGTRSQLDALITYFNTKNIKTVADVVYNHRDGGNAEDNPAVEGWIENLNCTKVTAGDNTFPSDRFRCYLPLGGSSGNGAGTYYFKIASASKHPNYYNKPYTFYTETNTIGFQNLPANNEDESGGGNGGGDCGQGNNTTFLGVDMMANTDDVGSCSGGCGIDEFALTIGAGDFNSSGDTLWIYMSNSNGNYSDHYIVGLWDGSADIQSQIGYQTYTDFSAVPSGRGQMDYTFFKPNGNATQLSGDWDSMLFFYDYDQKDQQKTKDTLNVWSKWLWEDVGIRGYRMDAVKHFNYTYVGDLMDYLHDQGYDPGVVVGEFFDTNAGSLKTWVDNVENEMDADTKSAINMRVFDFALRQSLKDACDAFGYDVRNVFQSGIVDGAGGDPFNVATFVNNHDYRDAGQPVANDPMLPYVYLLTNNQVGLPTVFYPDYFPVTPPNYPTTHLQAEIDALWAIHQQYIFQSSSVDYLSRFGTPYSSNYIGGFDNTTLLYQLSGGIAGEEVIVAINFAGSTDTLKVDHGINMTNLSVGDTLRDVLGNSKFDYALINGSNQMYIELPPRSYSVWVSSAALAPLPAELVDFRAEAEQKQVKLTWETAAEENLQGFEIERSADGRNFASIGWVHAKGSNALSTNYLFWDQAPGSAQTLYYRLKLTDHDQSYQYSPLHSVQFKGTLSQLTLWPNPTREQTELVLESTKNGQVNIQLVNTLGQEWLLETHPIAPGSNRIPIDLQDLVSGIYAIKIQMGTEKWVRWLVKK